MSLISETGERVERHDPGAAFNDGHMPQSVRGIYVVPQLHGVRLHLVSKRGQMRGQERVSGQFSVWTVSRVDDDRRPVPRHRDRQGMVQLLFIVRRLPIRSRLRLVRRRVGHRERFVHAWRSSWPQQQKLEHVLVQSLALHKLPK